MSDKALQVSDAALAHIRKNIQKMATDRQPIGIRVNIKKAGCSGYEYVLEFVYQDTIKPIDLTFTFDEVSVVVDKAIYQKFLKGGTTIDFQKEGMKEGLIFHNPNVANQCGCGESFTLRDES